METIKLKVLDEVGHTLMTCDADTEVSLVYTNEYHPGDRVALEIDHPGQYCVVQFEDTMPPALVYVVKREINFHIPFGEQAITYSPKSFAGSRHVIRARLAGPEEISARRNLAFNCYDEHGDTGFYPHASANVETRGEAVFAARNAIDGIFENSAHGEYPYQSWGINRDPNAALTLDFGREVLLDELRLTERADFPHDNYWVRATVEFSDGSRLEIPLVKSHKPQSVTFEPKRVRSLVLKDLIQAEGVSLGVTLLSLPLTIVLGAATGLLAGLAGLLLAECCLRSLQNDPSQWLPRAKQSIASRWKTACVTGALGTLLLGLLCFVSAFLFEAAAQQGYYPGLAILVFLVLDFLVLAVGFTLCMAALPLEAPADASVPALLRRAGKLLLAAPGRCIAAGVILLVGIGGMILLFPVSVFWAVLFGFWLPGLAAMQTLFPALRSEYDVELHSIPRPAAPEQPLSAQEQKKRSRANWWYYPLGHRGRCCRGRRQRCVCCPWPDDCRGPGLHRCRRDGGVPAG